MGMGVGMRLVVEWGEGMGVEWPTGVMIVQICFCGSGREVYVAK